MFSQGTAAGDTLLFASPHHTATASTGCPTTGRPTRGRLPVQLQPLSPCHLHVNYCLWGSTSDFEHPTLKFSPLETPFHNVAQWLKI